MRRARSQLKTGGFAIIILAGVNLFVLLCMCVLLTGYRAPVFGLNVHPADTRFIIGAYDRDNTHIITVTPGDTPRYFLRNREIPNGAEGLDAELAAWKTNSTTPVTVIIVCDEAASAGALQQVADKVLAHGHHCVIYGRPDLTE